MPAPEVSCNGLTATLDYAFNVTVYFAAHESFTRNVLGRRGWLDQVRVGLVEYESKLASVDMMNREKLN